MIQTLKKFVRTLGPGVLFASTCIGVSHLVQSTRAGAVYGYSLLIVIILANVLKYPFFEFAARYTAATGVSILEGYYKKGKWILLLYLAITIPSMFIVTAAVTFVTAGLLENLLGLGLSTDIWSGILLGICILILAIGRYNTLDSLLKIVGVVLLVSTLTAFISVLFHGRVPEAQGFIPEQIGDPVGIIFLIALMGWMPTAVDISTWISLWGEAKMKLTGYRPSLKEALLDFNFGYWVTAFLAICFLTLGATVIYGTNTELSNSSAGFAGQVIGMYTSAIGKWSTFVISIAAFSTMFSTTITVVDGYSRAIDKTTRLLLKKTDLETRKPYISWTMVISIGGFLVIAQYVNNLRQMVDLATILSFVVAPLAGFINYKVIFSKEISAEYLPKPWMKYLAIAGLIFLSGFTIVYFFVLVDPENTSAVFRAIFGD